MSGFYSDSTLNARSAPHVQSRSCTRPTIGATHQPHSAPKPQKSPPFRLTITKPFGNQPGQRQRVGRGDGANRTRRPYQGDDRPCGTATFTLSKRRGRSRRRTAGTFPQRAAVSCLARRRRQPRQVQSALPWQAQSISPASASQNSETREEPSRPSVTNLRTPGENVAHPSLGPRRQTG